MSFSTFKCKIDSENRRFSPVWTDKYLFILLLNQNIKPMCLICNERVAVLKRERRTNIACFLLHLSVLVQNSSLTAAYQPVPAEFPGFKIWPN